MQWDFVFFFLHNFYTFYQQWVFFSLLPVVLPSKQSTANSFGQMQITSLTSQPKSILQQERWQMWRRGEEGKRQKGENAHTHKKKRQPDKTSAGFAHLCQAEKAKLAGRGRRERHGDWEVVGEEKRKEEEMEAWCPRQQVPGIVFWGEKCIIMKAEAGWKSTANAKSQRKQLKCHCFSRPAQIPDNFLFLAVCFHTSFQMLFSSQKIPNVFFFCSLSEGFSEWYARGSALSIRCVSAAALFQPHFLRLFCRRSAQEDEEEGIF